MERVFFIDTDCELWHDKVEEFGLKLIQMPYILDGQEYLDDAGKETDYDWFFEQLKKGKPCKTAALNTHNYLEIFEPHFKNGDDIFYLHFSKEMSATFEFMDIAINELKAKYPDAKFRTFDTRSISLGAGIQCYYAGKMFKEGKSFDEIIEFLNSFSKYICCYFVVDDLSHLRRGGRISGATEFAGKLLGIRPVLHVGDSGKVEKFDKVRGKNNVVDYLVKLTKERRVDDSRYAIWILVTADSREFADEARKKFSELYPDTEIYAQQIGPVIGTHCGPGTIGVVFYGTHR